MSIGEYGWGGDADSNVYDFECQLILNESTHFKFVHKWSTKGRFSKHLVSPINFQQLCLFIKVCPR